MKNITNRLIIIAALVALPLTAHAGDPPTTFYSSLSAFNAAATTAQTYNFNGIAKPGDIEQNPAVLTVAAPGRVTFTVTGGDDSAVYANIATSNGGIYTLSDGTDSVLAGFPSGSDSTTTIALGGSYTAFAIEYGMNESNQNQFSFGLFSGNTQVGESFNAGSEEGDRFFGATSVTAFDNVRVSAQGGTDNFVAFDNARVGSAGIAVVPESGTLTMILPVLAVAGTVVVRRRRAA